MLASVMTVTAVPGIPDPLPCYADRNDNLEHGESRYENLIYTVTSDDAVCINDFDDCTDLVIPAEIDGKKVVSLNCSIGYICIGESRLRGKEKLRSVTLPDTVTSICANAFSDCPNLKKCSIPDSVKEIGEKAFQNSPVVEKINGVCYVGTWAVGTDSQSLSKTVTLREGTVGIADAAFRKAKSMTSVKLPDGIRIGENAFSNSGLKTVTFLGSITHITGNPFQGTPWAETQEQKTGLVYAKNYLIDGSGATGDITISGDVIINSSAFAYNEAITSLTLKKCKEIGSNAFTFCSNLKTVSLPSEMDEIGKSAFSGCESLASVKMPQILSTLGDSAFSSCEALQEIRLPEKMEKIGASAFYYCTSLQKITMPETLNTLGESAFSYCKFLPSLILPDSLNAIAKGVCENCISLESVRLPENAESIGEYAFENCRYLKSVSLPDAVRQIGNYAFDGCSIMTLHSPELPEKLESIGAFAFRGCHCIPEIVIPETCRSIGKGAFASDYPSDKEIIAPEGGIKVAEDLLKVKLQYPEEATFLRTVTILNPDCEISDEDSTFSSRASYNFHCFMINGSGSPDVYEPYTHYLFGGTIIGLKNSTAEAYAENHSCQFQEYIPFIVGDINTDGRLSIADAVLLARCVAEDQTVSLREEQLARAEIDGSTGISGDDLTLLLKMIAGTA